MREIRAGAAENYKMFLIGDKLAPMTVRKRLQFAKTAFWAMVKHRLIDSSPFSEGEVQGDNGPWASGSSARRIQPNCWRHALTGNGGLS